VQVVLHDAGYFSNGVQHNVANETYETVKALYPSMCTLDEALDEIAKSERDIYLNPKETADGTKCAQAVCVRGLQSRTVYFCATDQVLTQIYNVDASARLGYSLGSGAVCTGQELDDKVKTLHVSYIMPHKSLVSQPLIDYWHERKCKVCVWTVNDQVTMRTLCDMGVDGIITDYPEYCVEARAKG
jgi:glycerophosphoryl diester phosphodiesterase